MIEKINFNILEKYEIKDNFSLKFLLGFVVTKQFMKISNLNL